MTSPVPRPLPSLLTSSALSEAFDLDFRLREGGRPSPLEHLTRGAFVRQSEWHSLDQDARYALLSRGVAARQPNSVLSHFSAAASWGLPLLGRWPAEVHFSVPTTGRGQSSPGVVRHGTVLSDDEVVEVDGILLTSPARTALDMAAALPFMAAVAMVDRVLHDDPRHGPPLATRDELLELLDRRGRFRGSARARAVVDFASPDSGSAGESASRVSIAALGLPAPELQRVWIIDGVRYETDFFFPSVNGIGESDGDSKYLDPKLRGDASIGEVVLAEKRREDALRRAADGFVRWGYAIGLDPWRLGTRLATIGLVPTRSPKRGEIRPWAARPSR